jgi:putative ATP-binding cassette transporter
MQTANAFGHVNDALSWFINSYTTFAEWRATVDRLVEFTGEIVRETDPNVPTPRFETGPAAAPLELVQLSVALPDGTPLMDPATVRFQPHQAVLLKGPTGSGKSTLFRVLAGIWPFAHGQIRMPENSRRLFLPQRPYMPIGTLRAALWFPEPPAFERDAEARAALAAVDLPAMAERLDEEAYWGHRLSPGEQQRVAIARALLLKPDWLFLDEATSAMDEDQEAVLYGMLATALPQTTIISIGHRHSLEAHHARVIAFERGPGYPGHLTDRPVA